ncbi:MAG: hypothetical protein M3N13_10280 [Candidatus Eremiobacteraeota bacterium]|nr:hypothetical protein [Candidatus Eremiobacteraeota bacterium]
MGYIRWLADVNETMLYTTSVTIGELRLSIQLKADGRSRDDLERWLVADVGRRSKDASCRSIGSRPTGGAASRRKRANRAGRSRSFDGMIAAIAFQYDFPIVTRNERDFARAGVPVTNPWTV